jgi:predicted O-methyltransferase YrrM
MPLPQVDPITLDVRPLDWSGIPEEHRARFLNPGEPEVLAALVRSVRPRSMVEFGCQNGRTARLMLDNVSTLRRYLGIDVPVGYVTEKEVQRGEVPARPGELAFPDRRFRLVLSGLGSHNLTPADIGVFDVAFIDGDHSYAGVMNDFTLSCLCIAPGGLIIFHDFHDLGTVDVKKAVEEIHGQSGRIVEHITGTWFAVTRQPGP